ncbi:MAG: Spo0B domain-containing protein [Eubacteriales bacterium]|nr:Spo0B domain-containing protein [Eubacteriales bacterium]
MSRKPSREINVGKASLYAVIVNVTEIAVLLGFVLYVTLSNVTVENQRFVQAIAIIGGLMASWGAFLDIREALQTRKRLRVIEALEQTNTEMDTLNHTLRAQRHDFLNHLQVVYSLMEMSEYGEATDYIEKVYGEIRSVSSFLRTKSTAVNALLKVKAGACAERGIEMQLDIKSSLDGLTMPSWELCRVLANLIDNAMDALKTVRNPHICLTIAENLRAFTFTVANNGDPIPKELRESIFTAGVSTKGEGRGMGLSIVRQTLAGYGGEIACESGEGETFFCFTVPKNS